MILVFIKLKLVNLIPKLFIFEQHNSINKTKLPLFNNKYRLVFSRNMSTSTTIYTNNLYNKNTEELAAENISFRQ
ncbi:hypothetical protein GCM10023220_71520 [Streptomyces ziwulingensis]|uniref:Uncharacterized protein n=1 Tax=Streptomyces ziwulingensis TaxID=1045501 RepID=A0ABP9D4J2_9ACTN